MNWTWGQIGADRVRIPARDVQPLVRVYQGCAGWKYGLDSTLPEFQTYWMRLFWTQIIVLPIVGFPGSAYLWFTRDRNLEHLARKRSSSGSSSFSACSSSTSSPSIGERAISPSRTAHGIRRFSAIRASRRATSRSSTLSFPVYIMCGSAALMYATTRLPQYARQHLHSLHAGRLRSVLDPPECRPQRMGPCVLVHGGVVYRAAALGICRPRLDRIGAVRPRPCHWSPHQRPDRRNLGATMPWTGSRISVAESGRRLSLDLPVRLGRRPSLQQKGTLRHGSARPTTHAGLPA